MRTESDTFGSPVQLVLLEYSSLLSLNQALIEKPFQTHTVPLARQRARTKGQYRCSTLKLLLPC